LRAIWLADQHDLGFINAHFSHWEAVPADTTGGYVTAQDVQNGTADRTGSVDFSVGCHSGLSLPDNQAVLNGLDFSQAQLGQGVSWIANTGYGYGDKDEVAYSERLSLLFLHYLHEGHPVGDALRLAKANYYHRTGVQSFTPYDEKVLSEMTLYGLPMLQLTFPAGQQLQEPQWLQELDTAAENTLATQSVGTDAIGLTTQTIEFSLPVASTTIADGTYYHVNEETEVVAGMPILPRTSVAVTLPGETARGAFLRGGAFHHAAEC
jgi:hypothetical protein